MGVRRRPKQSAGLARGPASEASARKRWSAWRARSATAAAARGARARGLESRFGAIFWLTRFGAETTELVHRVNLEVEWRSGELPARHNEPKQVAQWPARVHGRRGVAGESAPVDGFEALSTQRRAARAGRHGRCRNHRAGGSAECTKQLHIAGSECTSASEAVCLSNRMPCVIPRRRVGTGSCPQSPYATLTYRATHQRRMRSTAVHGTCLVLVGCRDTAPSA